MNCKKNNIFNYMIIILLIILIVLGLFVVLKKYFNTYSNFEDYKKLSSVVILGTARDIEQWVPNTIEKVEMIMGLFEKANVIIYENDSKDNTLKLLKEWENKNNNVKIISETNVQGLRTQRLEHARNLLMNEGLKLKTEYIVVIDLDNVIANLNKDAFLSSFKYENLDWGVMCANQTGNYYDLWALRTFDDWMPFDFEDCYKSRDRDFCLNQRLKNIPITNEPIEVLSAFGGLAIYKTKYIDDKCKYNGWINNKETCEHVGFNLCIRNNGAKIYINPKMINH